MMEDANMIEESGLVVAIDGNHAVIEVQRRSACGHCSSGDSCGTSALAGFFSNKVQRVRLVNDLQLNVGEHAVIGINESVLLSTAAMAYMLPLILMITLMLTAKLAGLGEAMAFVGSMLGLFSGMQISNRIMGNKDYQSAEITMIRRQVDEQFPEVNIQFKS